MEIEEFKKILKDNKLSLTKFSELSGIKYGTCRQWGKNDRPVSDWVESWLNLFMSKIELEKENEECRKFKESLNSFSSGTNTQK